jgi:hypothetical protein
LTPQIWDTLDFRSNRVVRSLSEESLWVSWTLTSFTIGINPVKERRFLMLKKGKTYDEVYNSFEWQVPELYNIGIAICDKWADERYRLALIYEDEQGKCEKYTFWDLKMMSNRFANVLAAHGIEREDRIGILLPQCPETAISHIAAYKIGAIAVPLFTLFGPDALEYRLGNSEAKAVITDAANIEKIEEIRDQLPHLKLIVLTKGPRRKAAIDFWEALEKASSHFTPVRTKADDPALIIYTSGTTGPPKGALHAHRTVLGHLPGVEFFHNFFPRLAPRHTGGCLQGKEIRSGTGVSLYRKVWHSKCFYASHGSENDATGQRTSKALRLQHADHRMWWGNPGRRTPPMGKGSDGSGHKRILRPNGSKSCRGQLC